MSDTIEVFISYSKQDKELRDGLLAHMRPLEREGIITWHDRQILPGTEWDEEIKARLNTADIILLLISADFLATDYCTQVEIPEALRRHEAGEATVMPVILRSCGWKYTPLAKIQAYPEKAKPVISWTYIDDAYTNVVDGIYLAANKIKERRSQQQAEQEQHQQEQRQVEEQQRLRQAEKLRQQQPAQPKLLKHQELERQHQAKLTQEAETKRQQQPAIQPKPSPEALRGNYAQLEVLLKTGKWKEADQETTQQMYQVMGQQKEERLSFIQNIENFPCADLREIDQLWVNHSKGRFGFSVQKKIWQQCGTPTGGLFILFEKFGEEVGWRWKGLRTFMRLGDFKQYSDLIFDLSAPKGHLPTVYPAEVRRSTVLKPSSFSSLMMRCIECRIQQL